MHDISLLYVTHPPFSMPYEDNCMMCTFVNTLSFLLIGFRTQVDQTCGALRLYGGKAISALPENDLSVCS